MKIELGKKYKDIITGFSGVCTGKCDYITGCLSVLLTPKSKPGDTKIESQWFDDQRLTLQAGKKIKLHPVKHNGAGEPAPKI